MFDFFKLALFFEVAVVKVDLEYVDHVLSGNLVRKEGAWLARSPVLRLYFNKNFLAGVEVIVLADVEGIGYKHKDLPPVVRRLRMLKHAYLIYAISEKDTANLVLVVLNIEEFKFLEHPLHQDRIVRNVNRFELLEEVVHPLRQALGLHNLFERREGCDHCWLFSGLRGQTTAPAGYYFKRRISLQLKSGRSRSKLFILNDLQRKLYHFCPLLIVYAQGKSKVDVVTYSKDQETIKWLAR